MAASGAEGPKPRRDVRVLIVDDCILHRDSLAGALTSSGISVAGFAWDLATVATAIREGSVDIALVNIGTAGSAALVGVALATDSRLRVVVLGVPDDDESGVIACAEAGVAGYHTRTESFEDLLTLVDKVAAGESVCSPRVSAILMRRLSALATQQGPTSKGLVLTAREHQILGMLTQGLSNRDIAVQLSIAVHTVKNHVHSLLTKLGVSSRAQAVAFAQTMRYDVVIPKNQSRSVEN
jgi:DNA-binding NarL/FixJ family response regulator